MESLPEAAKINYENANKYFPHLYNLSKEEAQKKYAKFCKEAMQLVKEGKLEKVDAAYIMCGCWLEYEREYEDDIFGEGTPFEDISDLACQLEFGPTGPEGQKGFDRDWERLEKEINSLIKWRGATN